MKKGIRFRAYPNKAQRELIEKTFGCCRLIYNKGLEMRKTAFENGEKIGYYETTAMLTSIRKTEEFSFLCEVERMALQQSLRDLDKAYKNFFEKRCEYPKFKCKHNNKQSYCTPNKNNCIRISGNSIKLPKIGYVKIKQSMEVDNIRNVTVERTNTGKYFVVICTECEIEPHTNNGGKMGIDVGIKTFYSGSSGNVVENPRYLNKSLKKLKKEQRKLSKMIETHIISYRKGGKNGRIPVYDRPLNECSNIQKQRIKVAKISEKIANQRNDFLQRYQQH